MVFEQRAAVASDLTSLDGAAAVVVAVVGVADWLRAASVPLSEHRAAAAALVVLFVVVLFDTALYLVIVAQAEVAFYSL